MPDNASPGGYYAGIFWSNSRIDKNLNNNIFSKTGSLIFLKIKGEINEEGRLVEFNTINKKRFYSHLPVKFFIRFENLGNVHLKPKGEIQIIIF